MHTLSNFLIKYKQSESELMQAVFISLFTFQLYAVVKEWL